MGLKPRSIFATYIVMQNIMTLVAVGFLFIFIQLMFYPNGNGFIIFLYIWINSHVVLFQLVFFVFAAGKIGIAFYTIL
jgi:hypothetical protein